MKKSLHFAIWLVVANLSGCAHRFKHEFSIRNTEVFAREPILVRRIGPGCGHPGTYTLKWTSGEHHPLKPPPQYEAIDGRLIFSLEKLGPLNREKVDPEYRVPERLEVEGHLNTDALVKGGAYWWEPDGTYIRLKVEDDIRECEGRV